MAGFGIDMGLRRICTCDYGIADDTEGKQSRHGGFIVWVISNFSKAAHASKLKTTVCRSFQ